MKKDKKSTKNKNRTKNIKKCEKGYNDKKWSKKSDQNREVDDKKNIKKGGKKT